MNASAVPALLQAPSDWLRVDFVADLHLQSDHHATLSAWRDYLRRTRADAVFILGDLFEVWIGDDVLAGAELIDHSRDQAQDLDFAAACAQELKAASQRLALYFMHGNRDFLLGPDYASACGMTLLNDPTLLEFAGQRWLLSHGDALCVADSAYMRFRQQVRKREWQQEFLGKPLLERQLIGRELRQQSEQRKKQDLASGAITVDLDLETCRSWLQTADASTLIHGHTHRPAEHDLGTGLRRLVLSDWDGNADPARACVLRLSASAHHLAGAGADVERLTVASA